MWNHWRGFLLGSFYAARLGLRVGQHLHRAWSRYTGKERDSESGLDYFGARYYGSGLGRWTSPDWSAKEEPVPYAGLDNPQTLNLYAYVGNNPLEKRDEDGHCVEAVSCGLEFGGGGSFFGPVGTAVGAAVGIGVGLYIEYRAVKAVHEYIQRKEQARDEKGKFLPTEAGDTKPGANQEKKGLDAVDATKNTKPIPGSTRIPDGTTKDGGYVEVKGGNVAGTQQVKEMADAAKAATGQPLTIVMDPSKKVTKPVLTNPNIKIVKTPLN